MYLFTKIEIKIEIGGNSLPLTSTHSYYDNFEICGIYVSKRTIRNNFQFLRSHWNSVRQRFSTAIGIHLKKRER